MVRLNSALSGNRGVTNYAVSPDGQWVAYRANQDADQQFELFVVALDGGTPVKINGPLVPGGDVGTFRFSPDSAHIAYRADQDVDGRQDLYVAAVPAGSSLRLNDPARGGVEEFFDFLPDSARIAYLDNDPDRLDYVSPHIVSVGGGPAEVVADPEGLGGDVTEVFIAPDGGWIVYNLPFRPQWSITSTTDFSTTIVDFPEEPAGTPTFVRGTGRVLLVNAYPYETSLVSVDFDSGQDRSEVSGGYESWVQAYGLTPVPVDGAYYIVYTQYIREGAGGSNRFASRAFGGGSGASLSSSSSIRAFRISHDGRNVLYHTSNATTLTSVGILGDDPFQPGLPEQAPGPIDTFGFSGDDRWAIYTAEEDASGRLELHGAPLGDGPARRLSTPLPGGVGVDGSFVPSPDGKTVVYLSDQDYAGQRELWAVSVTGGTQRKLNLAVPAGTSVRPDIVVTADSRRVLFRAPAGLNGNVNLYSAALEVDSDADGLFDSCDNCSHFENPDQADANGNGIGDACDPCGSTPDDDVDGQCDGADNCTGTFNPDQADDDADGAGDVCDVCPADARLRTADFDVLQVFGAAEGEAALAKPRDVRVDGAGRVWVADTSNHRIVVFDEQGGLLATLGSNGTGDGEFRVPLSLDFAPTGEVLVVDSFNDRVQILDDTGGYIAQFGATGDGPGQFSHPADIAIAADGTIYVADTGNDRIQAFQADGTFRFAFGGSGGGPGQFANPLGIKIDPDGDLWIADAENGRIQIFDAAGAYLRSFGADAGAASALELPTDVDFADGLVFVTEPLRERVQVRNRNGQPLATPPLTVAGRAEGIDIDPSGRIWIVSRESSGRGFVTTVLAPADADGDDVPACDDPCPLRHRRRRGR